MVGESGAVPGIDGLVDAFVNLGACETGNGDEEKYFEKHRVSKN
jgi:hypothetical protein